MDDWNDPWKLASGDEQINRMVHALKICCIKQSPKLRKLEDLKGLPFYKNCIECCFAEACKRNYDHYCILSVTKVPLDGTDYKEFESNFINLRRQPDMFKYSFRWKVKEPEEVEV